MPPTACRLVAIPLPPPFLLPRSVIRKSINTAQKRCMGIRSIDRNPTPNPYNVVPGIEPLHATPAAAFQRKLIADALPLRTGALAIKKGMTAVYDVESGTRIACTVLQLDRNQVVSHKTRKRHGYYAVCVGSGTINPKNLTKPLLGHYSVQGVSPKRYQKEFRVRGAEGLLPVGEEIRADWFAVGQYVDTRSNCKGKGFAGPMKRWGFGGQPRSHGHSLSHRSHGSVGPSQGGGSRVYPGKKMAGNMGGQRNTVQSLKVLQSDAENGIVVVHGAVSGPKGCLVVIQDALKKPWIEPPPLPSSRVPETKAAEKIPA
ncbi:50S ribosomal protein L3 [Cladophialophora carrionii CBS 160.54]|uniref:Large ribosomal subunit protein uL3m n=1 Tax=Cladophialophora carrionii CBS 160.54 TaxID=1279043 RepID=V9D705_9EURO|nr:50S ribosomal protein L3 [Cladophialophora carrionii CBS 160.54]ETI22411.1 50S ribosomal protein L3 [Cladophialophora carrionii CBS 160.54]